MRAVTSLAEAFKLTGERQGNQRQTRQERKETGQEKYLYSVFKKLF